MPTNPLNTKGKGKAKRMRNNRKRKQEEFSDNDIQEMIPAGLASVFVNSSIEQAKREVEQRGLEIPFDYEEDMPELPNDIAGESHETLSDLLAQFQNAHSTAIMAASEHYIWHDTFEEIADYMENRVLVDTTQTNDTKRKAEARTDDRVVYFRAKAKDRYHSYVRFRDLAKTIEGKAKVVSRVGGFIGDDYDASDMGARKKSTRGKAKRSKRGGR